MPAIMRIEYVICSEGGDAFEWMDSRSAALSFAAAQPDPCYVEARTEYCADKLIIWASHSSMIEEA